MRFSAFLLIPVFAIGASARALSLDWSKCIEVAQANNAELAAARSAVERAKFQESVALSGLFPDLNGSLGFNETDSRDAGEFSASVSAHQNLFAGFQDTGKYKQALANTRAAVANLQIVSVRISKELKTAFASLRYAIEYRRLAKEIVARRLENSRLVDLRFAGGRENKGSVLLSKANLEQAHFEEMQARNAQRVAEVQLARALGVDEFQNIEITGEVPTLTDVPPAPAFLEIVEKTPEVIQVRAQEEAAERSVTVVRGKLLPSLDLDANAGQAGPYLFPEGREFWSAKVVLSVPLFSGGENYNNLRSAIADRTISQLNTHNVRRQTLSKLEELFAAYSEAIVKYKVDAGFLQAEELRAKIGRGKYGNNLLSFEDWDKIENDFIDRQRNFLQSKRNRSTSEAAWEQVQGKGALR